MASPSMGLTIRSAVRYLLRAYEAGSVVLLLAMPSPLLAKRTSIQDWIDTLNANHQTLLSHDWDEGLRSANLLINQIVKSPRAGDATELAGAVLQKAVALQGLGKTEDACWYGHVAFILSNQEAKAHLGSYGRQIKHLGRCLKRPRHAGSREDKQWLAQQPPMPKPETDRPDAADGDARAVQVYVGFTLDKKGHPHEPYLLKGKASTTDLFRAFEAVHGFHLTPGKLGNKTVSVHYRTLVNLLPD